MNERRRETKPALASDSEWERVNQVIASILQNRDPSWLDATENMQETSASLKRDRAAFTTALRDTPFQKRRMIVPRCWTDGCRNHAAATG